MDVGDGANASVSAGDGRQGDGALARHTARAVSFQSSAPPPPLYHRPVPPLPPPQTQQQPLSRDEALALAFPVSSAVGTSASDSHSTLDPETYNLLADTRKDEDSNRSPKHKRHRMNDRNKSQSIFESLECVKQILILANGTLAAQEALRKDKDGVDAEKLGVLTCQSLSLISKTLQREVKHIASSSSNAAGRQNCDLAHAKASRAERLKRKSAELVRNVGVGNDVVANLESSIGSVSRTLESLACTSIRGSSCAAAAQKTAAPAVPPEARDTGTQDTAPSSSSNIVVYQNRDWTSLARAGESTAAPSSSTNVVTYQRRDWAGLARAHQATAASSSSINGGVEKTSDQSFWHIDGDTDALVVNGRVLPLPVEGSKSYSPLQMCCVLQAEEDYGERCLTPIQARTHLKQVKVALRQAKYIGVKSDSQINEIYKKYRMTGSAKLFWGETGPPEIMPINDMVTAFLAKQNSRTSELWTKDETKSCLVKRKRSDYALKGLDPNSASDPDHKTVNIYHSALASHRLVTERMGKEKDVHRAVAETSERTMLTNLVGILLSACLIGNDESIPKKYQLDMTNAGDGLKLSREILAEALSVSLDHVHFVRPGLVFNMDDMASMYSQLGGLKKDEEPGLVLKENMNDSNRSYSAHREADEASKKRFRGRKGRHTSLLSGKGWVGTIWLQIPVSESELPLEKVASGVLVLKIEGLVPNSGITVANSGSGFVVFIRSSGSGVESTMFKEHQRLVVLPFIKNIREAMGVDPQAKYARALLTSDGGMTQLQASLSKDSYEARRSANVSFSKLAKNSSTVIQPADTGDGHMNMRRNNQSTMTKAAPTLSCGPAFDNAIRPLIESKTIVLDSTALAEIRGMVIRAPSVYQRSYSEKVVVESFVRSGYLDRTTLQGPDAYVLMKTLKKSFTLEQSRKWKADLPLLIREMRDSGRISEETFDSLGYPIDSHKGTEYVLGSNPKTCPHRERFLMCDHESLKNLFLEDCGQSQQSAVAAAQQELLDRRAILEENANAESKLHDLANRKGDDRTRANLKDTPVEHLKKLKGKLLGPFIKVRTFKGSSDSKLPTAVGNKEMTAELINKLTEKPNYKLAGKENCLLARAYLCRNVVELTLKDELDPESETVECEHPPAPSVLMGTGTLTLDIGTHSFISDNIRRQGAMKCFKMSQALDQSDTTQQLTDLLNRRDGLITVILSRLSHFKSTRLGDVATLTEHWAMAAFADNMRPLIEVVLLLDLVQSNPTGIQYGRSLLKSPQSRLGRLLLDSETEAMIGVLLVHQKETGDIVDILRAEKGTLKDAVSKYERLSKDQQSAAKVRRHFPNRSIAGPINGERRGSYHDLEMVVAVVLNPSDALLTSREGGLFVWSDRTIARMEESRGSDSMSQRQIRLLVAQFALLLHLMQDRQTDISDGRFLETFFGGASHLAT